MAAVKIICAARAGPTSLWRVGVPAFRHRGGSVGAAMQRRGLCCHVLARPGPAWPCVVCGPGLRLLLQAAVPSTRRLLRSRHAAPWAVLPRLGRGVRSWPAPALAGSGCRAISTTAAGFIEKSQLHETRPKRLRRSRFPRAGGCLELQAAAMGFKVPVTVTH